MPEAQPVELSTQLPAVYREHFDAALIGRLLRDALTYASSTTIFGANVYLEHCDSLAPSRKGRVRLAVAADD